MLKPNQVRRAPEKNNKEIFEDMPIPRALATLAIPTIIGQLVVLIYSLADTFYIGRTNNPLMVAGVSLILPVYNICISLASLAGVGGGSLISRLLGIREEAQWLVRVVENLLSVTRMAGGEARIRKQTEAAEEILGEAAQKFKK